jgi:hypothetical protein
MVSLIHYGINDFLEQLLLLLLDERIGLPTILAVDGLFASR